MASAQVSNYKSYTYVVPVTVAGTSADALHITLIEMQVEKVKYKPKTCIQFRSTTLIDVRTSQTKVVDSENANVLDHLPS